MNIDPFRPESPQYKYEVTRPETLLDLTNFLLNDPFCYPVIKRVGRRGDFTAAEETVLSIIIKRYVEKNDFLNIFHLNTLISVALARLIVSGVYEHNTPDLLNFINPKICPKVNHSDGWITGRDDIPVKLGYIYEVLEDIICDEFVVDVMRRGGSVSDNIDWPVKDNEYLYMEVKCHYVIRKYGLGGCFELHSKVLEGLRSLYSSNLWGKGILPQSKSISDPTLRKLLLSKVYPWCPEVEDAPYA